MFRLLTIINLLLLPATSLPAKHVAADDLSLSELEQRLESIDAELEQIAHYTPRSGVGSIGYRSKHYADPHHTEWAQINLEKETPIDLIALVPPIWRDRMTGFKADGFPVEFRIIAGTDQNPEGTVLASFSHEDQLLPRIAPVLVPCKTTASWVRVEATELSPRHIDGQYNLELAELLVFNDLENVALNRPVTASNAPAGFGARNKSCLTDGFVPYQMDASRGNQQMAFMGGGVTDNASLTIDLEASYPINQIYLHAVEVSDSAPQAIPSGFAMPERLLVEGANEADFSDATTLVKYHIQTVYDTGPIIMRRFTEKTCRYIRVTALKPYIYSEPRFSRKIMGFAEIELLSKGQNVALEKTAEAHQFNLHAPRPLSLLTDGCNIYGQILPVRQWMTELARRHELELERPLVADELNRRYLHQKTNLRRMIWLAVLLTAGIVITILVDRMLRMRHITKIRERFAADLHDELGANLHAIGMLGELAKDSMKSGEGLEDTIDEICGLSERTSAATRYCIDRQSRPEPDLPVDMRRTARRVLANQQYDISVTGENLLKKLKPGFQHDLFLFYKESLVNISRHSDATHVYIELAADKKKINLTIADNGQGFVGDIPPSLKRRARILKGRVNTTASASGGTQISLTVRPRELRFGQRAC
jgi:signal transduction histidine kinase